MQPRPPAPMFKLYEYLPKIELVCLAGAVVGVLMKYMGQPGDQIIKFALSGLAVIYFLGAFKPPAPVDDAGTTAPKKGFMDLLFMTILPKIAGISSAVAIIGVLFALLQLPGASEQLFIGCSTLGITLVLFGIGLAAGNENAKAMTPMLYRMIPIFLISVYFYMKVPPTVIEK